jgi:ABC transporter DrrB family efflux protein
MNAAIGGLGWALRDAWTITQRDLRHWVGEPSRVVWTFAFPIVFVLLFGYVFGSSMTVPGGGDYREFLMPGLFAVTMAFGLGETMFAVAADSERGVTDRFRTMPMAQSAVVVGRCLADLINSALGLVVLVGCALVVGWEWHGSLAEAAAAFALLLWLRFAFLWVGVLAGLMASSTEAAGGMYGLLFPVTMISAAFAAPEAMPGWLETIAAWNPISSTAAAVRDLFGNPGVGGDSWIAEHALEMAVVWPLVLVAVFLPLTVRRFQRLSR